MSHGGACVVGCRDQNVLTRNVACNCWSGGGPRGAQGCTVPPHSSNDRYCRQRTPKFWVFGRCCCTHRGANLCSLSCRLCLCESSLRCQNAGGCSCRPKPQSRHRFPSDSSSAARAQSAAAGVGKRLCLLQPPVWHTRVLASKQRWPSESCILGVDACVQGVGEVHNTRFKQTCHTVYQNMQMTLARV